MYYHPVIARQMLGCQRRPEILIAGLHLLQHRRPELRCVGPVRHAPAVPMLQCFRSSYPISCPHPFRLPITQLQQLRRFAQPQTVRLHPTHHFHSTQLFPAQSRSPQSRFLLLLGQLIDLLSLIAPPFVYPAVGWHSGATPGMRTLGLRVVDARSGHRLTWGQSLLRTAGWWWSLLTLGAGFVPILAGRWRRGLPDWMASSLVVAIRPLTLVWIPGPYGWVMGPARPPQPAPLIPTARDVTEPQAARASWSWTDVIPQLTTSFGPQERPEGK